MKIKMQTVLAAVSVLALAGCASQSEKEKQISAQQLVDQELREQAIKIKLAPVSYTHLTLPTNSLV